MTIYFATLTLQQGGSPMLQGNQFLYSWAVLPTKVFCFFIFFFFYILFFYIVRSLFFAEPSNCRSYQTLNNSMETHFSFQRTQVACFFLAKKTPNFLISSQQTGMS